MKILIKVGAVQNVHLYNRCFLFLLRNVIGINNRFIYYGDLRRGTVD